MRYKQIEEWFQDFLDGKSQLVALEIQLDWFENKLERELDELYNSIKDLTQSTSLLPIVESYEAQLFSFFQLFDDESWEFELLEVALWRLQAADKCLTNLKKTLEDICERDEFVLVA